MVEVLLHIVGGVVGFFAGYYSLQFLNWIEDKLNK